MPPKFLPRFVQKAAIADALFGDPALQGSFAHAKFARHIGDVWLAAGDAALNQNFYLFRQ